LHIIQVVKSKWGFGGGAPSTWRFLGLTTKIINQGRNYTVSNPRSKKILSML